MANYEGLRNAYEFYMNKSGGLSDVMKCAETLLGRIVGDGGWPRGQVRLVVPVGAGHVQHGAYVDAVDKAMQWNEGMAMWSLTVELEIVPSRPETAHDVVQVFIEFVRVRERAVAVCIRGCGQFGGHTCEHIVDPSVLDSMSMSRLAEFAGLLLQIRYGRQPHQPQKLVPAHLYVTPAVEKWSAR